MTNSGTSRTNSPRPTSRSLLRARRFVRLRYGARELGASVALAIMLLVGPISPLAAGLGAGPAAAYAASLRGNQGTPNRFNPHADATSTLHLPSYPASTIAGRAGPPQSIAHGGFQPHGLGHVALDAAKGAHFASSDGTFQVDVPTGAVSAADVSAAGGTLSLQVAQIAPPSGSNAGGSGIVSFGTFLLQVVDAHGVLAKQGLRQPVTVRLDYGKAAGVDLQHAFVTLNGALPATLTTATAATTTTAANPALAPAKAQRVSAAGLALGKLGSQNTTLDATNHQLLVAPLISNPSTSMTWNTTGPIASFGKPDIFNADLSAGALSAGLSIDVPTGPGGLTPPISLSYSSAGVSENHSVQAAASWVGEGWNLSMGAINWAEHDSTAGCVANNTCNPVWESSWQLSDPYGTGSELIPPNLGVSTYYDDTPNNYYANGTYYNLPAVWHTASEGHAKIVDFRNTSINFGNNVNPPCFRVWLTNGLMEEFGCTSDSLLEYVVTPGGVAQYYLSGWLLDMITDPQGNQIHLTYQRDMETQNGLSYPRDAVLSQISWDSPGCHNAQTMCTGASWAPLLAVNFLASHTVPTGRLTNSPSFCNTGSNLRCDDPNDLSGSGGLVAPAVQSTFVLTDIQVQVHANGVWNTLKDYQLSYQQNGPGQITDASTGKTESTAGYLNLTKITEVGDDGTTALPTRTFGYTYVTQYYEDDTYHPNPSTTCGPSWNAGNGNGCLLWSQSYAGNSWYLNAASNGMGLQQTFSWENARNNTHGVNSGASNANPIACNDGQGNPLGSYPCDEADDQAWSHAVLTQESGAVVRAASGGNQTVTSTTGYTYFLTTGFAGKECGDCSQGMYWGNENENDYLDYYNGKYMGFAETDVSHPDGSLTKHKYYATTGWGVYDNTQITGCAPNMQPQGPTPCPNDPWWNLTNAAHGHEYETDNYDTNGTTLLTQATTQYQAPCPPWGVSGSGSLSGFGNFNGNLVSELDHSNPVAACAVQTTRTDDYTYDGASSPSMVPDATTTYSYDNYGRVTSSTTSSNNGGVNGSPATIVHTTTYIWNDAVSTSQTSASGTYLIDFPAYQDTEDSNGNRYHCDFTSYDGPNYATNQQSSLTLGEVSRTDTFATSCGTASNGWTPSGDLRTSFTYDTYGNRLTTTDPDANWGIAGHVGCTVGSTQYSTCDAYDSTFEALPTTSANALNQASSTGYGSQSAASAGFGLWAMSATDSNGKTTSFTYDALGRMTSQTLPGEGSGLTTASWTYTDWCSGTAGQMPCVELDETKRLDGTTTITNRAFYDGYGNLVETRNQGPAGQDVVAYAQYDSSGHLVFESNSYFVPAYSGGPGAAAYATPDSTQAGTTTTYDGLERVTSVRDALSNVTNYYYALECYNGCYEAINTWDALNHIHIIWRDTLGRQVNDIRYTGNSMATFAQYASTHYTYDYNGNLTQILQPDQTTKTTFTYDLAGRKTGQSDPDRGSETYSYDPDGNLVQSVDARGAAGTVYAGYDGLDRLLWRNSTNSPTNAYATFSYDSTANGNVGVGRLTSETFTGGPNNTLAGSYVYVFDQRGQQISSTLTIGSTSYPVQKTYDDSGNVLTQTYPDGEVATTGYTAQGWFAGLSTQQGSTNTTLVSSVTYAGTGGAASQMTGASLGNGLYTYAANYDLDHRLTNASITRNSDNTVMFQSQPSYDAVGNVVAVSTTLQAGSDNQAFCYDEQNRLTWAGSASGTVPCGGTNTAGTLSAAQYTQSFSYDNLGRLTSGPLGSYTYGDSAHLHAATSVGGTWTAAYDAAGETTCRAPSSSMTCAGTQTGAQLSYNLEGYPVSWQNAPTSPSTTDSYLYDGEGNRVEQQVTTGLPGSPSTTTTVYVGNLEEVATSGSTTTTTTYYYAGPQRIAEAVNGTVSYLGNDSLGSADVALSSSSGGGTTAAQLFAPYGSVRYSSGVMPTDYGFTGQHSDAVTGLDYYVSRYYDPLAGQFASADTALPQNGYDPWGLSRYAYVQANPETYPDPDGHCWPVCTMLIGAAIGAAIGAGTSIVSQAAAGHGINWGEVGKQAAVGAVSGAISGLAGPEAGLLARGAIDTAASVGGQVVSNALEHKPLGDGVGQAALTGALMSVGMGAAGGLLAKGASRFFGSVAKDAEGEAGSLARGASCALSFSPDTAVATPNGEKPIAQVKTGDAVTAYNPSTGRASPQTVTATSIHHDDNLVDVTLQVSDQQGQQATSSSASGSASTSHNQVTTSTGAATQTTLVATSQGSGTRSRTHQEVVHTTTNHPWLTADHGWLPASFLHLGEAVQRADGTTATVVAIHAVPGAAAMWDLTVSNVHTFAVGAGEYVVHNNCGVSAVDPNDPKAFEITDWSGYPTNGGVGKPDGPFKLLEGDEYDQARAEGNRAARAYKKANGLAHEEQPHHIHPVKFGGDPTDPANLTPVVSPWPHQEYTNWWNDLQDELEAGDTHRIRYLNGGRVS